MTLSVIGECSTGGKYQTEKLNPIRSYLVHLVIGTYQTHNYCRGIRKTNIHTAWAVLKSMTSVSNMATFKLSLNFSASVDPTGMLLLASIMAFRHESCWIHAALVFQVW